MKTFDYCVESTIERICYDSVGKTVDLCFSSPWLKREGRIFSEKVSDLMITAFRNYNVIEEVFLFDGAFSKDDYQIKNYLFFLKNERFKNEDESFILIDEEFNLIKERHAQLLVVKPIYGAIIVVLAETVKVSV